MGFRAVSEFKRWADRVHGGVMPCFRHLDSSTNSNGKLSKWEFAKILVQPECYGGDVDFLFENFDVNNVGKLTEDDVKFLDYWDISQEDMEVEMLRRPFLQK